MIRIENLSEANELAQEEMVSINGGIWGHVLAGVAAGAAAYMQATDYDLVTDDVKNAGDI